jgi:hypothetical protein
MSVLNVIAGPLFEIIDKLIPDKQAKAAAQLEILKLNQSAEFKQLDAELEMARNQTDINKIEAANSSVFVSGWRPAVGWVCVLGLTYTFLAQPLLAWASGMWAIPAPPQLDLGELLTLLMGMLGLGALRTTEKIKNVAR